MAGGGAQTNQDYAAALARAFAGALIFALPLLMTMEMWQLGFSTDPWRLALFLCLGFPLLFGLSYYSGFEVTAGWVDDLLDACAAYGVGFIASATLLTLFAEIEPGIPPREFIGKIAIQSLPAAIGAMLTRAQLRGGERIDEGQSDQPPRNTYGSQLFLMAVGALFVAFNVAPTEEIALIAHQMSVWHVFALSLASMLVLHLMVFSVGFAGQEEGHGSGSGLRTFLHFTLAGYAIALGVSLYILWTFGRTGGIGEIALLKTIIVLGFPASLGAAAARLLV